MGLVRNVRLHMKILVIRNGQKKMYLILYRCKSRLCEGIHIEKTDISDNANIHNVDRVVSFPLTREENRFF